MDDGVKTLDNFEETFGEKPVAEITIEVDDDGLLIEDEDRQTKGTTNYVIRSVGKIGRLSRTVSTSIKVAHGIAKETESSHHPAFDYALYSASNSTFKNAGGAKINGSVYAHDIEFDATNTIIDGDIISEKSINLKSAVNVKGNIYAMNGFVKLSNSDIEMKGDIHATEDVTLSHGTIVDGNIYTNRSVTLHSSNAKVTGDIHAGGNVSLGWAVDVNNLFTNGNVKFDGNNIINGEIHAGGVVGDKDIGNNVTVWGNIFSNSHVYTRNYNNYVYKKNVYAGKDIYIGNECVVEGYAEAKEQIINNGTIKGGFKENGNALEPQSPIPPYFDEYETMNNKVPLHSFEIGANNIVGNQNSATHDILPGFYNNLITKWNDTINFSSGNYYFNNINAENSAIKLQLDLSNGPINIYAKGNIYFASGLDVSVSQDGVNYRRIEELIKNDLDLAIKLAGQVYWESHANYKIAENCYFLGSILANKNLTTSSSTTLVGAYAVNEGTISMGYGPVVIYAPPTDSAAGGSGGSDGTNEDGDGENNISPEDRITTSSPIREK
jgi:predicted acyltransferase (DUF342 family)